MDSNTALSFEVAAGAETFVVERARRADVPAIVDMLRDDVLGTGRESTDLATYFAAFEAIERSEEQLLALVRDAGGQAVATMQLTLIPGLSREGATRLQIEGVRVAAAARSAGLGGAMLRWAADYGRYHGARIAQLTTDKRRTDAHRFYERLGYVASHEGMKIEL
ncbi:GNAT family N-acetyltransferase [Nocardia callitridis]|uniref:GNAT family N-acetyltransferase n=1 Tax=Nocardia callitridis TaxID=648753 RepID=A0ABP9K2V4_9NOCA